MYIRDVNGKKSGQLFLFFTRHTTSAVAVRRQLQSLRMTSYKPANCEHGHYDRDDLTIEFEQFMLCI